MVDARRAPLDDEAAPQGLVGVGQPAPAPVVRRHEAHLDARHARPLPPAELGALEPSALEIAPEPEPADDRRAHRRQRRQIEMVEVVVADQRRGDGRQLVDAQRGRHVAPDAARDAVEQDRVGQQIDSVELHQEAGMPEPRQPRAARLGRRRGEHRAVRLDPRHRRARGRAPPAPRQPIDDAPLQHVGKRLRAAAIEVDESPASQSAPTGTRSVAPLLESSGAAGGAGSSYAGNP